MQVDDHGVARGTRSTNLASKPILHVVPCARDPGLGTTRLPPRNQLLVDHLRRPDDRNALTIDGRPPRLECLSLIPPTTNDRHARTLGITQRVLHANGAVIHTVIVGNRDNIDTTELDRLEGRGGSTEQVCLVRRRCASISDYRLEIDHRDISTPQDLAHRRENLSRV